MPTSRVALFATCVNDALHPRTGIAAPGCAPAVAETGTDVLDGAQ
ncbi:hypothetical protein ACFWFZ_14165 [Streptomyces sp. NPDC060232]